MSTDASATWNRFAFRQLEFVNGPSNAFVRDLRSPYGSAGMAVCLRPQPIK